jgi:hypothetical protein
MFRHFKKSGLLIVFMTRNTALRAGQALVNQEIQYSIGSCQWQMAMTILRERHWQCEKEMPLAGTSELERWPL